MMALDAATASLVRLAAAIAGGEASRVSRRCGEAIAAGVPPAWGDELLLQSRLMVGYPRTLSAAQRWREAVGQPAELPEGVSESSGWTARGETTCRVVYGANYEKLRDNVRQLHPALDAWMVSEGYGGTIGRPGLDLVRRELCVIAQVTVLDADRQLQSHLRGALNVGATAALIDEVFVALGDEVAPGSLGRAIALWGRLR